jgi:cytochrome o ubiquinol oxidase subunit II
MGAVLDPAGLIAERELAVMTDAFWLMLITLVAVWGLALFFAYWYRESNTRAVYLPNWEHGALSELVWWAIPFEIVLILGALLVSSTHELDPSKALAHQEPPLAIQAVALPHDWLFIYPEYEVATVGVLYVPTDRPLNFSITADAPMNSLWIPALGGQIYAMTGMATKLHLLAEREGEYRGGSANYSGVSFANMAFMTHALSPEAFAHWASDATKASEALSLGAYAILKSTPTNEPRTFNNVAPGLFASIIARYLAPTETPMHHTH